MTKSKEISMTEGPILTSLIRYTIPILLSGLLQCFYNAADSIVVGQFAGNNALAAVGSTASLVSLITNLFIGFSVGSSIRLSIAIGAKDDERCERVVHSSFAISLLCGIVIMVIGYFGSHTFLKWSNTPQDIIDLSTTYLKIFFLGSVFSLVYNFGAAIIRAKGDSKSPLIYLTISGIINVGLNILFVVAFRMDVAGVALATIISQLVSAVLVVNSLVKDSGVCRLTMSKIKFYTQETRDILITGLPAGIHSTLFSIANTIIQAGVNSFSTVAIAGNTASANIGNFIYAAVNSTNVAASTAVGQNYGSRDIKRIKKLFWVLLGMSTVLGMVFGWTSLALGKPLLRIWLPDSPESIAYGLERLTILASLYFIDGWIETLTGFCRGLNDTFIPMIVSVFGICVFRLVWIFTYFEKYKTLQNLLLSYPISWIITFIPLFFMAIRDIKTCEKWMDNH